MGGDDGPSVVVPAALDALKTNPALHLILVGQENVIHRCLKKQNAALGPRLKIKHASEIVTMDELPSQALRGKKDSSMRIAINLVKEGVAQACVSAGNTGALMATAKFVLKTLPGVARPAIIAELPTMTGPTVRVLDLGANVDSSPESLFQFAVMGSAVSSAITNNSHPRLGLLNIGEEEIKGNEQVKEVAELLSNSTDLNYIGYVEGDDIFKGNVDVVVCDGFVGNVALKTSEGLAKLILFYIKQSFFHNWLTKLSGLAALHVLKRVGKRVDPARYNGASFIGLNGIVIKSHGSANRLAFATAIEEAIREVQHNVPQLIKKRVAEVLGEESEQPST